MPPRQLSAFAVISQIEFLSVKSNLYQSNRIFISQIGIDSGRLVSAGFVLALIVCIIRFNEVLKTSLGFVEKCTRCRV